MALGVAVTCLLAHKQLLKWPLFTQATHDLAQDVLECVTLSGVH